MVNISGQLTQRQNHENVDKTACLNSPTRRDWKNNGIFWGSGDTWHRLVSTRWACWRLVNGSSSIYNMQFCQCLNAILVIWFSARYLRSLFWRWKNYVSATYFSYGRDSSIECGSSAGVNKENPILIVVAEKRSRAGNGTQVRSAAPFPQQQVQPLLVPEDQRG